MYAYGASKDLMSQKEKADVIIQENNTTLMILQKHHKTT